MIKIKESELHFSYVRSSGPGGQHVNKVSTAVQLKYNVMQSDIPEELKQRFNERYRNRISKNGFLTITAQSFKSQKKNKDDAVSRLEKLFSDIKIQTKRIPTKPSRGSKVKRIEGKKKRSVIKKNRMKVNLHD
ncbi:MAG: aminoacyl-tRNA hydrolase [Candidatus Marinimicrobia bacterium]|nr:aminoacyl-tRNA hydrolase [Candidatus Neomarinimicrobiota bacterium]